MVGKTISHYKILEKLGEGGMGVVYKAHDTNLDRVVALKFLPDSEFSSSKDIKRLILEAKTAASLNHPNICTIFQIEEYDGGQFISMEYVKGSTLRDKLSRGLLPVNVANDYAMQLCDALGEAHEKGIIHRDVKPENIMIDLKGRVKMMDFGLAKLKGGGNITKQGKIYGTLSYMSPEQLRGETLDLRSDIFSLGLVLYEMLTGIHPLKGEYEQATGFRLLNDDPKPPCSIRTELSLGLDDIVMRCLEKEPDQRYNSCNDLKTELEGELHWPLQIARKTKSSWSNYIPVLHNDENRNRKWKYLFVVGMVLIAVFLLIPAQSVFYSREKIPEQKHLAVLPFLNLSNDLITANLSDGIMEILTSKITQFEMSEGSLWVVPSSEVRVERVFSVTEASQQFGVNLAVTGSLQSNGNLLLVTINLVDVKSLRQLRSDVLSVEWTNFSDFQDLLAQSLIDMLELELGPPDVRIMMAGSSEDPVAYQLYVEALGSLSRFEDQVNIETAIELFRKAIDVDPEYVRAYAGLAEAYWRKYELTRDTQWTQLARQNAEKAMELGNRIPEVFITLALINNGMQNYSEALIILDDLKEQDSMLYAALIEQAKAYEGLGLMEEAEDNYRRAIEQKKSYWSGYNNLGRYYSGQGEFQKAAEQFQKAIKLTPDNVRVLNNLGAVYGILQQIDDAIETFERSNSVRPNERAMTNLGTLYFMQRDYDEAVRIYEQATDLLDTHYRTWGYLGHAYKLAGEDSVKIRTAMEKALELAKREREITPENPSLLIQIAGYHLAIGNRDSTRSLVNQIVSQNVQNSQTMAEIANLYEQLGERDYALYWVEEALNTGFPLNFLKNLESMEDLFNDPRMDELKNRYEP